MSVSFVNQGLEVLEVQSEVSTVCDDVIASAGVGGSYSTVFYQVQSECSHLPGDFKALHASICLQSLRMDPDFLFQHDLAPAQRAKTATKWFC